MLFYIIKSQKMGRGLYTLFQIIKRIDLAGTQSTLKRVPRYLSRYWFVGWLQLPSKEDEPRERNLRDGGV